MRNSDNRTQIGRTRTNYRADSGGGRANAASRSRGFVTLTMLIIVILAFVAGLPLLSATQNQVRASTLSQNRMTGLVLAEAGIDAAVREISSNTEYTGGSGTLYEDPPTNTKSFGTFTTTVTKISDLKRKVVSVGTNTNGTTTTAVAIVQVDTRALGNAAIMANGPVDVGGTMDVNSTPTTDLHISHIYANGNVSMGGSSFVDGYLMAAGTVTGTAYFPSQSGVDPYPYPTTTQTDTWKSDWIAAAQAGGTRSGVNNTETITAPMYINGDISLSSSKTLTLNGSGVIYVNGNVNLTSQSVLTNGVTLVVSGTFEQTGQSTYKITTGITPTPTLVVYGTSSSASSDVIKLTGGSLTNQQGIIYAVKGNIKVAGGSIFVGALVAGGSGNGVNANGGYTHRFPDGMASPVKFPTAAVVSAVTEL